MEGQAWPPGIPGTNLSKNNPQEKMSPNDPFRFPINRSLIRIELLTAALVPQVVALELRCGLSTRGIDGYHLLLADPSLLAFVALVRQPRHDAPRVLALLSATLVLDELHIDNLATDPDWRQQGLAGHLLQHGLNSARERGARTAFLEVRPSNLPALALYLKCGFLIDGRRTSYYQSPPEDALLLSCRL